MLRIETHSRRPSIHPLAGSGLPAFPSPVEPPGGRGNDAPPARPAPETVTALYRRVLSGLGGHHHRAPWIEESVHQLLGLRPIPGTTPEAAGGGGASPLPWPTQSAIAYGFNVEPNRVRQWVGRVRRRWLGMPSLTALRGDVFALLERYQVMPVEVMVQAVLELRGGEQDPPSDLDRRRCLAVLRAAFEAEVESGEPRFRARRRSDRVFLVLAGSGLGSLLPAGSPATRSESDKGLAGAVDEIVDSVLDAADEEILEDLGERAEDPSEAFGAGAELLKELMLDVLRRHRERKRRQAA